MMHRPQICNRVPEALCLEAQPVLPPAGQQTLDHRPLLIDLDRVDRQELSAEVVLAYRLREGIRQFANLRL